GRGRPQQEIMGTLARTRSSGPEEVAVNEVSLPQGTVRYRDSGSGPPVVFLHGLLVDGRLWRKVTPLLEGSHRCLVPDLPLGSHTVALVPGADLSPPGLARLVAGFLEQLELDGVTLVANDTGGALAQITAANHPERIGRLLLTNCDSFENFLPPAFRPLQWAARVPGALTALLEGMRFAPLRRLPMAYGWLIKRDFAGAPTREWVEPYLSDRSVRRDTIKVLRGSPRSTPWRPPPSSRASIAPPCSPGRSRTGSSSSPTPSDSPPPSRRSGWRRSRTPTPSCRRTSPSGSPS